MLYHYARMTTDTRPKATARRYPRPRPRWRNWARNQECAPVAVDRPASEDQLLESVRKAIDRDQRVKVVGSGHSFTGIALTDGRLISLENYQRVLETDREKMQVRVQAGIRLSRLYEELAVRNLAVPNVGDIAYQSISGAISTATHGTGKDLGGLATQVAALRLIAGDGAVIDCSADTAPDIFSAARVGLGALGVISTVTLQCVPAFSLRAVEMPMRVDQVLEDLDSLVSANEHFEFFWVPHTGWALTKQNNRTDEPATGRGRWKEFRDDVLYSNVAFGIACRIGRWRPTLVPWLVRNLVPGSGPVEYVDRSDHVFASPRLIRFYEMEYEIPIDAGKEAFTRVRDYVQRSGILLTFPIEVRFTAADDIPLSTASGRASCYIAVHVYEGTHYQQYFEAVEDIMDDYGGRPHWGKLHFQTAETLAQRYPQWDAFQKARAKLDPKGRFSNPYLDRVIGPVGG
ncbi:MAG: FAD-binding protein [Chloroflexi bacterium]|nr:MAG: FAD-binding protein [Chloroflexota bacterium]